MESNNNDTSKQQEGNDKKRKKEVRVWVDGCFDMMHFGHANALRQARELGDYLIVGVHSDAEILKNKGPTVMKEDERYRAVAACKWVNEVVRDAPYVTDIALMESYDCDFCVHGDDLVSAADGTDCYEAVKKAGKFRVVKRTKGISTTDLVGRMILLRTTHFIKRNTDGTVKLEKKENFDAFTRDHLGRPLTISQFIPTSQRIEQFASGKQPQPGDKIVYIDGSFDLFHDGHIQILQKAKEQGDYLIVGLYDDQTVNQYQGKNLPIMNVYERVLGVLSCRYVDEVVIGAPLDITKEMIDSLKINIVCCGTTPHSYPANLPEPYKVPKELGILKVLGSPSKLSTPEVIDRILKNHQVFEERNKKKESKELNLAGKVFTT